MTLILFPDQVGRYIKIVQTGSKSNYWSMHEFYVWGTVNSIITGITAPATVAGDNLLVFPNPANSRQINLQLAGLRAGKYHLRLLNYFSQLVYNADIILSGNIQTLPVTPGRKLAPGTYVLELTGPQGERATRKIIIL